MGNKNIIYHYCSLEAFNLIMKSKTIRLCDITKSNDKNERKLIGFLVDDAFERAFDKVGKQYSYKKDDYKVLHRCADGTDYFPLTNKMDKNSFKMQLVDELKSVNEIGTLGVCFSSQGNLLSQWRGYADDGCGLSIGFDVELLKKYLKKDDRFQVREIEYDIQKQLVGMEDRIFDMICKCVDESIAYKEIETNYVLDYFDEIEDVYDDYVHELRKELDAFASVIKDQGFSEERETRIVFDSKLGECLEDEEWFDEKIQGTTKLRMGHIDYLTQRGKLIPYIDLNYEKAIADGLIKKIYIGPKAEINPEELKIYLYRWGYYNVDVESTDLAYC